MDRKWWVELLKKAEIQYKFALALNTTYNSRIEEDLPNLSYLAYFAYGKYGTGGKELRLNKKEEKYAVTLLEHSAIYLIAVQIDSALEDLFRSRFNHPNKDIRTISCIIRLIRNAFAHNPFAPRWLLDRRFKNKTYTIGDLTFRTNGLNNKLVKKMDYGGPVALLLLSKFVRTEIENLSS